jgi:hypothetical protein
MSLYVSGWMLRVNVAAQGGAGEAGQDGPVT